MHVCLSVYQSVCLSISLAVCLSVCLFVQADGFRVTVEVAVFPVIYCQSCIHQLPTTTLKHLLLVYTVSSNL